jgi:hypothetical protein
VGGKALLALDAAEMRELGLDAEDPASPAYRLLVRLAELDDDHAQAQAQATLKAKAAPRPRMPPRRQSEKILEIIHLLEHSALTAAADPAHAHAHIPATPIAQYARPSE